MCPWTASSSSSRSGAGNTKDAARRAINGELSRRWCQGALRCFGYGTHKGDWLTGEGLNLAVSGADTIVHRASSPFHKARQVDVEGTERLLEAAARAGVSHVVYISNLSIDLVPSYSYYRTKLDTERVIEGSPVPYTILWANQFYDLVLMAIRFLDRLPVMVVPKGFLGQPIDVGEVADRLVELALSEPAGRVQDVGGPEVRTLTDLARGYFEVAGRRRKIFEVPLPGKMARVSRGCADARVR